MKNFKKILASLLVVVMVLTATPLRGFVGLELPDFDFGIRASAKTVASSGECGANVTYTYDSSTGELVISGVGSMTDYSYRYDSPFYDCNIKSIIIKDGVTTIGSYAFYDCDSLTSLTICNSVTTIGSYAFYDCGSLTSVTIPDCITAIGDYAFYACISLANVTISDYVTTIGSDAFYATSYYNDLSNWENNVLYIGKHLIRANPSLSGAYEVKEGTLSIAANAFRDCDKLKELTLKDGVETINDVAFLDCPYLESINFPDSLKYIGKDILKNTAWFNYRGKGLIIYDNWAYGFKGSGTRIAVNLPANVKGVAGGTFTGDGSIISFEVDEDNPYFASENGVLFNKDKTELIAYPCGKTDSEYVVPDTVKVIREAAFSFCNHLKSVVIPDSVTTIGDSAFYYCSNLRYITMGNNVKKIGRSAFDVQSSLNRDVNITDLEAWCKIDFTNDSANPLYSISSVYSYSYLYINGTKTTSIVIPDTIIEIKPYTFCCLDSLTSVAIGENVTNIGYCAFKSCDSLTSVTIPDSVTTICNSAFRSCDQLTSITLGKDLQIIGDLAFNGSTPKDVYYSGSQEDWENMSIGNGNYLTNADLYLMHNHDYTVTVSKEPTCTTAGEALYTCVHGDTKIEVIQSFGHSWDEGKITSDSTCSKGGKKTYTCTTCFTTKVETIETLEHNYQLRESYAPTCDEVGYDIYVCTQCTTTETRETASSLGHDFSTEFTVDIDSTCTATGIKSKHCKRTGCKETMEETVIPLKGHTWQSDVTVTKVPTCTAEGESVILCKDCKIVKPKSNKVIAPLGHNASEQEFTVDVKATCVSFGKQSKHCTRCNYVEQVTQIPMSEHDYYVAEESTATCDKPGIAIYVCRMCKDSYTVENSPALGHDFEYIIIETPTCTREGYEYGDCTRCDATETRPVPTIDHDYVRTEVSPTCLDDGLATYTCSYGCGKTYDEVIPALGHSYPANWVTILPATCTERGSAIKICRACSEVMSQVMPKLSHTDSNSDGVCDECGFGGESKPDTPEEPDAPEEPDTPEVPDTPDIPDEPEEEPCDCDCHAGGIKAFFFKLINFFAKIFDKDARTCECGAAH